MSAIPWLTMAILSPVVGYYNPIPQPGEPGYEAVPQHHFRGTMENDSAFDKDSDYSHGTRLDYAQSLANGDAVEQNIALHATPQRGNSLQQGRFSGAVAPHQRG